MTLHFHWLHAPRWMAHAHFSRAVALVLGVIGVSMLFSALRVLDAAVSGGLVESRPFAATPAPRTSATPASFVVSGPAVARPIDDSMVVPEAAAEAISL